MLNSLRLRRIQCYVTVLRGSCSVGTAIAFLTHYHEGEKTTTLVLLEPMNILLPSAIDGVEPKPFVAATTAETVTLTRPDTPSPSHTATVATTTQVDPLSNIIRTDNVGGIDRDIDRRRCHALDAECRARDSVERGIGDFQRFEKKRIISEALSLAKEKITLLTRVRRGFNEHLQHARARTSKHQLHPCLHLHICQNLLSRQLRHIRLLNTMLEMPRSEVLMILRELKRGETKTLPHRETHLAPPMHCLRHRHNTYLPIQGKSMRRAQQKRASHRKYSWSRSFVVHRCRRALHRYTCARSMKTGAVHPATEYAMRIAIMICENLYLVAFAPA